MTLPSQADQAECASGLSRPGYLIQGTNRICTIGDSLAQLDGFIILNNGTGHFMGGVVEVPEQFAQRSEALHLRQLSVQIV